MAKYRYRIEGGRYGGELVVGETNPICIALWRTDDQEELIEAVLDADGIGWNNEEALEDALIDPTTGPGVDEYFNMWENDELEHCNGPIQMVGLLHMKFQMVLMITTITKKFGKVMQFKCIVEKEHILATKPEENIEDYHCISIPVVKKGPVFGL